MGIRTPDLLIANEALYQLSYRPLHFLEIMLYYNIEFLNLNGVPCDYYYPECRLETERIDS